MKGSVWIRGWLSAARSGILKTMVNLGSGSRRLMVIGIFIGIFGGTSVPFKVSASIRYSLKFGLGSSSIKKDALVDSEVTTVNRSESPVALMASVDLPLSDFLTVGAEHTRGISLTPLSSGVSFTGIGVRWYLIQPMPVLPTGSSDQTVLYKRAVSPYLGFGFGIAAASVTREFEPVETVKDSGFYFTPKLGAEMQWSPGLAGHAEVQMPSASGSAAALGKINALHFLVGFTIIP